MDDTVLHACRLLLGRYTEARERRLARENRRAALGKGAPRGGSFLGTAEHPLQRKQAFVAALKRVGKEIGRMRQLDARAARP